MNDNRELAVEGMRGLAALVVIYVHIVACSSYGWHPPSWLTWPVDAGAAVMVFFTMSGYVIGIRYPHTLENKNISHYIWKRIKRLMPINILAVFLAVPLDSDATASEILSNLAFLGNNCDYSGLWIPVLTLNLNLWSLNYEVLYYALFIPVWIWNPSLKYIIFACAGIAVMGWYSTWMPTFLACYAAGFIFWIAGLALAWNTTRTEVDQFCWPACLLIANATWKLQGAKILLSGMHMPMFSGPSVKLYDLDFLPVVVWLFSGIAQRTVPKMEWVRSLAIAIPILGFYAHISHQLWTPETTALLVFYVLGILLLRWRITMKLISKAAPIGAFSFSLYALSRPIQEGIFLVANKYTISATNFTITAIICIIVSISVAWYVDVRWGRNMSAIRRPRIPRMSQLKSAR